MKKIKLSEIIIPKSFLQSNPSKTKMERYRNKWRKYNKQPKPLIVDKDNVLVDGYIQYLILKELGYEEGNYLVRHESKKEKSSYRDTLTTYVYGIHPNCKCQKEFLWRIPKSWTWLKENIQVRDRILCNTKFGYSPVIVTRVETLDKSPVNYYVKRVATEKIKRDEKTLKPEN